MHDCNTCGGCSGCGGALELTEQELVFLRTFAQCPFLPVARKASEEAPVYLESGNPAENALILQCLEKKALIDIDYHLPLKGYSHPDYDRFPIRGSLALTERGQKVLELLEVQGIGEA